MYICVNVKIKILDPLSENKGKNYSMKRYFLFDTYLFQHWKFLLTSVQHTIIDDFHEICLISTAYRIMFRGWGCFLGKHTRFSIGKGTEHIHDNWKEEKHTKYLDSISYNINLKDGLTAHSVIWQI